MNDDKYLNYSLLNNYNNYNIKTLKLNELKLYVNNKLTCKFNFYGHQVFNKIVDVNYQIITKINFLDLDNFDIEFYSNIYGINADKSNIKIFIYSNLYNKKNNIIDKPEIIEDNYILNDEPSTILNEEELNILNWINN